VSSELERRLSEFVDRDQEMARFCALLDSPGKLVLSVTGPGGIGKSSLMARMIHEIAVRGLSKVEIIYTDDNLPEFMAILRKCRDDIDVAAFGPFTALINYYTVPRYTLDVNLHGGTINVGNNMTVTDGATVGNISGIVIDKMITSPRSDLDVSEAERRTTLTNQFVQCLAEGAKSRKQIVILIDAAEKMNEGTGRWLWDALIGAIADAKIDNIRFAVFGRTKPTIDRWKKQLVDFAELQPLAIPDIELYLEKRGVGAQHRAALAQMVFAISKGNPLDIATHVDLFLELQEQQGGGL
jgi:hypothetical protein